MQPYARQGGRRLFSSMMMGCRYVSLPLSPLAWLPLPRLPSPSLASPLSPAHPPSHSFSPPLNVPPAKPSILNIPSARSPAPNTTPTPASITPAASKTTSNMNYGLTLSLKVEQWVLKLPEERERKTTTTGPSGSSNSSARSGPLDALRAKHHRHQCRHGDGYRGARIAAGD